MNRLYEEDLENVANSIDINALKNKTLFITGANGLIGRFIVDLIMYINKAFNKDLCVMNYTNRYDISTGKPNPYHRIIGIKVTYKNGISNKEIELKINMNDFRKKKNNIN